MIGHRKQAHSWNRRCRALTHVPQDHETHPPGDRCSAEAATVLRSDCQLHRLRTGCGAENLGYFDRRRSGCGNQRSPGSLFQHWRGERDASLLCGLRARGIAATLATVT